MAAVGGREARSGSPGILAKVPRLLTLNHAEVLLLGRDGGDEGATLDLMRPEDSPWLQGILKEVKSEDEGRRMFAVWRFKETLRNFVTGGFKRTKAVNVSIFVLTNGFAAEIHRGLEDAILTGRWYFIAKDALQAAAAGKPDSGVFSRVSIYAAALEALIVDSRTLRFLLKEMPDLFLNLANLFLKAQPRYPRKEPLDQDVIDPGVDTRKMILRVLGALLIWDSKAMYAKQVVSVPGFMFCLIEVAMENVFDAEIVDLICRMLDKLELFFESGTDEMLALVARLLDQGTRPRSIYNACSLLIRLFERHDSFSEIGVRLLKGREELYRSPFLALAVCREAEPEIREYAQIISSLLCFEEIQGLPPPSNGIPHPEMVKAFELAAIKDKRAMRRARQMTAMWKTPAQGRELYLGPIQPLPFRKGLQEVAEMVKNFDRKPCRKCSRAGCDRVEASYKDFKICAGCMLACYCSRGKSSHVFPQRKP